MPEGSMRKAKPALSYMQKNAPLSRGETVNIMEIRLSDHFTYKKLLRFTFPSIVMMIFTSIYGVVDGFFVSNFVGKTPFAAVNLIIPFLMILGTVGFMFGTGGSALIAKTMGEGNGKRANDYFSLFVYFTSAIGAAVSILGFIFIRDVASFLGAEGEMLEDAVLYGRVLLPFLPAFILQLEFQSFMIAAEKPGLGLCVTVASGVANMVFDAVLVGVFRFGLVGAASATAFSYIVGGIVPIIYFACPNSSRLRLSATRFDGGALIRASVNGSSEFMSNISMSLVSILYNFQLIKYAGEDGVAAYGVLMYVGMIFSAAFIGYSIGSSPVVGFHYGADDREELHGLLKKSIIIIGAFSLGMTALALVMARPLSHLFVGYDKGLFDLTVRGFTVYSFSFLFMGFAIFGSGFFTALNDGVTSAAISFLRTLVFQVAAVIIMPMIWEIDGIWMSLVVSEFMAVAVSSLFLIAKRGKYGY